MFLCAVAMYGLDHYEKEPKHLLGIVFFWGAFVAASVAFLLNTILGVGIYLITGSEETTSFTTGSLIAPIIEESLKGFAVLIIFWFFKTEFDSILDGIIYAAVTALGFAATENSYYIYQFGFLEHGWEGLWSMVFIRDVVVIWQHPFYTAFIGIGFAITRMNQSPLVRYTAPIIGWIFAILTHAFHNTFAEIGSGALCILGSILDWSGWIMMFIFILWLNHRERKLLEQYLKSEVDQQIITPQQYKIACSLWRQMKARYEGISQGKFKSVNQFYQLCGELSHKKHQYERLGEEKGNTGIIIGLRRQIMELSSQLTA
jgi:protease PrsW